MIQQILSGLEAGSWYGLIGLALVVTMKSTGVANFAVCEMGLLSAFVVSSLLLAGIPFWIAIALGLLLAMTIGPVAYVVLLRPLPPTRLVQLMMTIALALVMNAGVALVFGASPREFKSPWSGDRIVIADQVISVSQLITVAVGAAMTIGLTLFFRSSWGARVRAIAEDRAVARLHGINEFRVTLFVWGVGSLMASVAMILATQARLLAAESAAAYLIRGFTAAILGGFSSLQGAFIGGLALGVLENVSGAVISTGSKQAIALVAVLLVLLWKPRGLFGGVAGPREV